MQARPQEKSPSSCYPGGAPKLLDPTKWSQPLHIPMPNPMAEAYAHTFPAANLM